MKFLKGFYYAFRGIASCVCNERNLRVHIIISIYVLYFSQFYSLDSTKISIVFAVIALVMALELVNTAVERVCDKITLEESELIRVAKDMCAGAVLVASIFSVAVGFVIFWDTKILWNIVSCLCNTPEYLTIFIISILVSILFVVVGPKGIVNNIREAVRLRREFKQEMKEENNNIK